MPIHVAFQEASFAGSYGVPALGDARVSETVLDAATGSLTAENGEVAIVSNVGSAVCYVAHGSVPDGSATVRTGLTSARYAIPVGGVVPFRVNAGDKFAVEAT